MIGTSRKEKRLCIFDEDDCKNENDNGSENEDDNSEATTRLPIRSVIIQRCTATVNKQYIKEKDGDGENESEDFKILTFNVHQRNIERTAKLKSPNCTIVCIVLIVCIVQGVSELSVLSVLSVL